MISPTCRGRPVASGTFPSPGSQPRRSGSGAGRRPGGLDRSVVLTGEQNLETPGLGVDEQAGSGVQGAPGREAGSIRASARLSDLTPPELHEGRDPLAEGRVYSTGSGDSCSTHNPRPIHPHPRAVGRSKVDPAQVIVEPSLLGPLREHLKGPGRDRWDCPRGERT